MPITEFQAFGTQHLVTIAVTLVTPILLIGIVRRANSEALPSAIGLLIAAILMANEVAAWSIRLAEVGLPRFAQAHLPLHVCGIAVLATVATLVSRSQRPFEITYFWGLVGATNAVLTPGELDASFPDYRYIQYFVAHSGIVVGALYATWGLGMRPTLAGLFRAFAALNLFAAAVAVVNYLLGSNYMYLSAPPAGTVSPFLFAPWPWYLLALELIGLALFFVAYAPFIVSRRLAARSETQRVRKAAGNRIPIG